MTNEELLNPRWEVISNYPQSIFTVGQILDIEWNRGFGENFEYTFTDSPHIFKPLEWWKARSLEDLPKYLKSDGDYYKVESYFYKFSQLRFWWKDEELSFSEIFKYGDYVPATEEEYLNQTFNETC